MHNPKFMQMSLLWSSLVLVLLLSACGSLEIGVEHVPSNGSGGEVNWRATAETLQSEATRVSSGMGQQPVPTLVPAAIPATVAQPTLAYVYGGDIWVRPMPAGEAVRLTFDGRNQEPRWSASGEWLSYVKNPEYPELWVMRHDGREATQLASGVSSDAYAWSPVEDKIVRSEMGTIFVVELQTGNTPLLVQQVEAVPLDTNPSIGKVAWSPNGQTIAFTLGTETNGSLPDVEEATPDGLWLVDASGGTPTQLLMSQVPDKGPFVLYGWSGDGGYVLYWQAPILSASILADGVALYRISAQGGSPEVVADPVLVHDDAVQSQPNGMTQLAVVVGGGRDMWHDKRLHVMTVDGSQKWELTPFDQAVSSPAWSPMGDLIAYVGMGDLALEQGHPDVNVVLQGRQLWIVEPNRPSPRPVPIAAGRRIESPQWINDEFLLVASLDINGGASLITTDLWGESSRVIVDELTPAPEWFGYYGHIEWSNYFSLWRPRVMEPVAMPVEATPTFVPTLVPMQPVAVNGLTLAAVLEELDMHLTSEKAVALWGEPNEVVGSGLIIYKYFLDEGLWLWLGFPGVGPLSYAHLETPSGDKFGLVHIKEGTEAGTIEAAVTVEAMPPTPTPAAMDLATATPMPTAVPPADVPAEPTPTPATMIELTATPLPTSLPPTAVAPEATPTP